MTNSIHDIAVIGGGASGTLLSIQLLRRATPGLRIALIERGPSPGRGIAYAESNGDNLLNTRPGDVTLHSDQPDHFARWLAGRVDDDGKPYAAHAFVPRRLYGDYLAEQLAAEAQARPGMLTLLQGEVIDIARSTGGLTLALADGGTLRCRLAVLATGHAPPSGRDGAFHGDPWSPDALAGLAPDERLLIIGTGLTMADLATTLDARGHRGRIVAMSRRGLLPRSHPALPPAGAHHDMPEAFTRGELSARLKAFRRMVRGGESWSGLMHATRAHNAELWHGLSEAQRRRFLRHLRPWWDVHRHRLPPLVAARIAGLREAGRLEIRRGRIAEITPAPDHVDVAWSAPGTAEITCERFDRVIDCRGPRTDPDSGARLARALRDGGLAGVDPLGLSFATDDADRVSGPAADRLFALGPPTRGRHWEITAMPDIRRRGTALAERLLGLLAADER